MTRGMLVTVLYRMAGNPEVSETVNPFSDVDINRYYGKPVLWASSLGLVEGRGAGIFDPNGSITRQDMVAIFYWYAKYKGYDVKIP